MPDEEKKEVVEEKIEEIDWEARYNEKDEQLAKVAAERENYKKVALSKKGKDADDETEDERIERIVNEKLQGTNEAKLLKEKDEVARAAINKVKELTVALKNRSQIGSSAGQGGGQNNNDVKTEFWTQDQLSYFKKRGIDPEKAKENYLKIKTN